MSREFFFYSLFMLCLSLGGFFFLGCVGLFGELVLFSLLVGMCVVEIVQFILCLYYCLPLFKTFVHTIIVGYMFKLI